MQLASTHANGTFAFICHAHADRDVQQEITWLQNNSIEVWYDRAITPGSEWNDTIARHIVDCQVFIYFLSPRSAASEHCRRELNFAQEEDKHILTVELEPTDLSPGLRLSLKNRQILPKHRFSDAEYRIDLLEALRSQGLTEETVDISPTIPIPPAHFSRRSIAMLIAVLIFAVGFIWFVAQETIQLSPDKASASVQQPLVADASIDIVIHAFEGMAKDLTGEIGELLSRSKRFAIHLPNPKSKHVPEARYELVGIQAGDQLSVSVYDNEQQTTRWVKNFDLSRIELDGALQDIANGIAREFGIENVIKRPVVSNELYLSYLQVRALRDKPTTKQSFADLTATLSRIIKQAPRFSEAHALLCSVYTSAYRNMGGNTEHFTQAERNCFTAARLSPNNPWVLISLGNLYSTTGQLDEARGYYKSAQKISPNLIEVSNGIASLEIQAGEESTAIAMFEQSIIEHPDEWSPHVMLADLYFRRGDFNNAIEHYSRADEMINDPSLVRTNLGAALFMAEEFEQAIKIWETVLSKLPDLATLTNLGSAHYFEGDFDSALAYYKRAIDAAPTDYRGWLNAGEAAFHYPGIDHHSFYERAIELATGQYSVNPDDPDLLSALALCYASISKKEDAQLFIQRAINAGSNIYVLYEVAVAQGRLGLNDDMARTLADLVDQGYSTTLLAKDPNFPLR